MNFKSQWPLIKIKEIIYLIHLKHIILWFIAWKNLNFILLLISIFNIRHMTDIFSWLWLNYHLRKNDRWKSSRKLFKFELDASYNIIYCMFYCDLDLASNNSYLLVLFYHKKCAIKFFESLSMSDFSIEQPKAQIIPNVWNVKIFFHESSDSKRSYFNFFSKSN